MPRGPKVFENTCIRKNAPDPRIEIPHERKLLGAPSRSFHRPYHPTSNLVEPSFMTFSSSMLHDLVFFFSFLF